MHKIGDMVYQRSEKEEAMGKKMMQKMLPRPNINPYT